MKPPKCRVEDPQVPSSRLGWCIGWMRGIHGSFSGRDRLGELRNGVRSRLRRQQARSLAGTGAPVGGFALLGVQYTFDLSDEGVLLQLVENPYWRYFSGEKFFRHELPIGPWSMSRWRKRVGCGCGSRTWGSVSRCCCSSLGMRTRNSSSAPGVRNASCAPSWGVSFVMWNVKWLTPARS